MQYYYNIDGHPQRESVLATLNKEMGERYRERKNYRHRHFKNHYAGPEDLENVLSKPPDHCTKEAWQLICEMFLSERFLARSAKNQANRRQMKYVTTQGTKLLAAKRHQYVSEDVNLIL